MPAYIRKYRVYQNSRPKKSISCQNNEYRAGHSAAGRGVQFYLQYLLSDRTHAGCQLQRGRHCVFFHAGRRVPREELGGMLSLTLSCISQTKTDSEPEPP